MSYLRLQFNFNFIHIYVSVILNQYLALAMSSCVSSDGICLLRFSSFVSFVSGIRTPYIFCGVLLQITSSFLLVKSVPGSFPSRGRGRYIPFPVLDISNTLGWNLSIVFCTLLDVMGFLAGEMER